MRRLGSVRHTRCIRLLRSGGQGWSMTGNIAHEIAAQIQSVEPLSVRAPMRSGGKWWLVGRRDSASKDNMRVDAQIHSNMLANRHQNIASTQSLVESVKLSIPKPKWFNCTSLHVSRWLNRMKWVLNSEGIFQLSAIPTAMTISITTNAECPWLINEELTEERLLSQMPLFYYSSLSSPLIFISSFLSYAMRLTKQWRRQRCLGDRLLLHRPNLHCGHTMNSTQMNNCPGAG